MLLSDPESMHLAPAQMLLYMGITGAKGHLLVLGKAEVLGKWGLGV